MIKAAFIDRDGVINNDTGHYYIYKPENFVFNKDIPQALKKLKDAGYLIIVITNQGGIARQTYTEKDVDNVHSYMISELKKHNIEIDEIYFCPHHSKYQKCLCRKPEPLMIEKAIARFGINKEYSFMIGDNMKDVEAANAAGIKGYKIEKNTSILSLVESLC